MGVFEALHTFFPCPLGRFHDQERQRRIVELRQERGAPKGIGDAELAFGTGLLCLDGLH